MRQRTLCMGLLKSLLLAVACLSAGSCSLFDDGDGCHIGMNLNIVYDYNMKFADALNSEVRTAHVYVYDESGRLVLSKTADFEPSDDGMGCGTINVDELQPEVKYDFVVWATGKSRGGSYDFGPSETERQLTAKLKRADATISDDITPLFHGRVEGQSFAKKYGTTQAITIPLTKDTKNIKLVLQQQSGGSALSEDDFSMEITDDNGFLGYDNSLLADEAITYKPWIVTAGEAGTADDDTKASVLVAEFSVNRLVKEGHSPLLTVRKKSGGKVLSIPLIDYALLVKGHYNQDMDDQEYLDRQDTFDMTFFLDEDKNWINVSIIINSWRVVLSEQDLK